MSKYSLALALLTKQKETKKKRRDIVKTHGSFNVGGSFTLLKCHSSLKSKQGNPLLD